jgi:hypothetical protein
MVDNVACIGNSRTVLKLSVSDRCSCRSINILESINHSSPELCPDETESAFVFVAAVDYRVFSLVLRAVGWPLLSNVITISFSVRWSLVSPLGPRGD